MMIVDSFFYVTRLCNLNQNTIITVFRNKTVCKIIDFMSAPTNNTPS